MAAVLYFYDLTNANWLQCGWSTLRQRWCLVSCCVLGRYVKKRNWGELRWRGGGSCVLSGVWLGVSLNSHVIGGNCLGNVHCTFTHVLTLGSLRVNSQTLCVGRYLIYGLTLGTVGKLLDYTYCSTLLGVIIESLLFRNTSTVNRSSKGGLRWPLGQSFYD